MSDKKVTRNMSDPESRAFWERTEELVAKFEEHAPAWVLTEDLEEQKRINDARAKQADRARAAEEIVRRLAERNPIIEADGAFGICCKECGAYVDHHDVDIKLESDAWAEAWGRECTRARSVMVHHDDCLWLRARAWVGGK